MIMNTTETKVELLPCPWCDERPELEDGDVVVSHSDDCFFSRHYSQEMWLIGRKLERWNHRTPDQSAITAARDALKAVSCAFYGDSTGYYHVSRDAMEKARQALERLG
jgi:sarcosine oxidase delta subunit